MTAETAKPNDHSIVITGYALRLPGANSPEEFWQVLEGGVDRTAEVSERRRELAFAPNWRDIIGEIDGIEMFDAEYFGIEPAEAITMDPQHRVGMEVAHDALASAGLLDANAARGRRYSVYAAISTNAYYPLVCSQHDAEGDASLHPRTIMNVMNMGLAARISQQYDFTGPVMSVDTACSSFLTAMSLAVDSIRYQQCDGAVVAGANLLSSQYTNIICNCAGITTSHPFTRVFDEQADGTLIGEGVVVAVLEREDIARRNNRRILGRIRGHAINNDGSSLNIMAPSPRGQADVIRDAYTPPPADSEHRQAVVDHTRIGYIEVHGTGTRIGDPIELNALGKVYRKEGFGDAKVGIGSVKTNIGHLLSAAGGAGLVKLLLSLQHGVMAPNLHLETVNPLLSLEDTPFQIITEPTAWPKPDDGPRLGAITSLGLGGTNVHFVIEEGDEPRLGTPLAAPVLVLSAQTETALERLLKDAQTALAAGADPYNVAMTLARYRTPQPWRAVATIGADGRSIAQVRRAHVERPVKRVLLRPSVTALGERIPALIASRVRATDAEPERGEVALEVRSALEPEPGALVLDPNSTDFEAAAELHLRGCSVAWARVFPDASGTIHEFPPYPFEREPYWLGQ
ncbi:polyketide synthase [Gulosibacter hominis]|uniref:polyketide synthase n=1 Tax=Gulosibacter hominis TaxID=2770504 RepID=UPI001918159B|nr:polyketide synthase [Gulosibacter hominis]